MPEEETLINKVTSWLHGQGYPLEMQIAAAFREAGFTVFQSAYFHDAVSGKYRELDIVVFRGWKSKNILWRLSLLIECKVSKGHPWIMFTRALEPDDTQGQFHYYRTRASKLGSQLLARVRRKAGSRGGLPLLNFEGRPGYGIQRITFRPSTEQETAKTQRQDVAFEAATKMANAATLQASHGDDEAFADMPMGEIVLPIIVIDGHLFDAHLDENRAIAVSQISSGVLDWNNPVAGNPPTWVRIVIATEVQRLVAEAERTCAYLESECEAELRNIDELWLREFDRKNLPP